jgi:hypothetical protein
MCRFETVARELIEGLQPASLADLAYRHRFLIDAENSVLPVPTQGLAETILEDMERLSAAPVRETVVSHDQFRAAREQRQKPIAEPPLAKRRQGNADQPDFGF